MDNSSLIQLGELLNKVKLVEIDDNISFWMMRAKGGFFYDEFLDNGFIALGWNYIDKNTSLDEKNLDIVKDGIKRWYGDKVPTTAVNKCKRFLYEFKVGDFVVIPNKGSSEIIICKIGEYYEVDRGIDEELLAIKKIENGEYEIGTVKCPYKKRRKVEVLLRVSTDRIGYHLLRAMASYHGLNNLDDYATDVLNCVYDAYLYENNIMFSINVAKTEAIKAREISRLMFGISELFCEFVNEDAVSIAVNLNSPGKVVVKLQDAYKNLKKGAKTWVLLTILLFGGGVEGLFEVPGIANGVINTIKTYRTMDIEIEMQEEDLKGKKLENYLKVLEIIEATEDSEMDIDKNVRNIEFLQQVGIDLNFETNEIFSKPHEHDNKK